MSGQNAAFGSTAKASAKIAQDFINAQGGIDGHHVIVDVADDQSSSTVAVDIARKYVSQHQSNPLQCPAVYQISQNPITAPLQAAILNKAKILMFASQSPDQFFDTSKYPYFFSISPPDKALGDAAAHFLVKNHLTKIGVLTNHIPQEDEYIADMKAAAEAAGSPLTIVKTAVTSIGAVNVQTQLTQLRDAHPDVVLVATEFGFGPIWQSFHAIGWTPKIMGDVGFFYDGYNALGNLGPTSWAPCWWGKVTGDTLPADVQAMVDKIAPLNGGYAPDPIIAANVAAGQMLLAKYAIEKNHTLDPAGMSAALNSMDHQQLWWKGMQFSFSADKHTSLVGPYGAGICNGSPLGKVGKWNSFVYTDDYRSEL